MDKLDVAYWQGKEPKTTKELQDEIQSALRAAFQWLGVTEMSDEDRALVEAQIYWLRELLKLGDIQIKKHD